MTARSFYSFLLIAAMAHGQTRPKPAKGYYVKVYERNARYGPQVEVCSVLPPGTVVGGGDNCDFHTHEDPVFCLLFRCTVENPEKLSNDCGTSFGCQNLKAFEQTGKDAR